MRLPSILAHVLATSTLLACGGQTTGVGEPGGSSGSSSGTTPPSPTGTTTPPLPPTTDGGVPDSGTCAPKLVRQGGSCSDVYQQTCGVPAGVDPSDGMSPEECKLVCGASQQYWGCNEYKLADLPGPSFECYTCVEGRRPQGYVDPSMPPDVAGWLAHAADLERVSVDAFQILTQELIAHGAPSSLALRAKQAELDEVHHTRIIEGFALAAGGILVRTQIARGPVRSLVEIALENGVEGCIRETYGALVAAHQAQHAGRVDVRSAMRAIAHDETQHAELAWDLHTWLVERLGAAERARVESAMERAVVELAFAAKSAVGSDLVTSLGLPSNAVAERLVAGLSAQLFTPALAVAA